MIYFECMIIKIQSWLWKKISFLSHRVSRKNISFLFYLVIIKHFGLGYTATVQGRSRSDKMIKNRIYYDKEIAMDMRFAYIKPSRLPFPSRHHSYIIKRNIFRRAVTLFLIFSKKSWGFLTERCMEISRFSRVCGNNDE